MLKRFLVGLTVLQFTTATTAAWGSGGSSDAANIRSMRANALQHFAQGQVDMGLKIFEDAIAQAERTFGKDSTFVADLCFDAGVAAFKTDQYQKAEHCLSKAVAVNPNATEARLKLADYYRVKGRLNDAKSQLSKVLRLDPNNVEARELLALTYQKEGNAAKANKECFELEELIAGRAVEPQTQLALGVHPPAPPVNPLNVRVAQPAKLEPPKPAETPKAAEPAKPEAAQPVKPVSQPKPAAVVTPQKLTEKVRELEKRLAKLQQEKQEKKRGKKERRQIVVPVPQPEGGLLGSKERINAKAVLLTKMKGGKQAASESTEINAIPVQAVAPIPKPKASRGFVPPPPPIPIYPAAPPPTVQAPPPTPKPALPALKPAKPIEDPIGERTVSSPSHDSDSHKSSAAEEDPDFLLDWAGKKKKGR